MKNNRSMLAYMAMLTATNMDNVHLIDSKYTPSMTSDNDGASSAEIDAAVSRHLAKADTSKIARYKAQGLTEFTFVDASNSPHTRHSVWALHWRSAEKKYAKLLAAEKLAAAKVGQEPVPAIPPPPFYKLPLHSQEHGCWVYDADSNFVFQFEREYAEDGSHLPETLPLEAEVVASLNALEHQPIARLQLTAHPDKVEIHNNGKDFITIRGWGGLTGIGGHNLDGSTAAGIQDHFLQWIMAKLTA